MKRVVVVSPEWPGSTPMGGGIRALELARALRDRADVALAVAGEAPPEVDGTPCTGFHPHDPGALREAVLGADVVLSAPRWPRVMRVLRRSGARLIFDLYDPEPLALVPGFPGQRPALRRWLTDYSVDRVAEALHIGHQFVCSSERQRDLWLGVMLAERLIDPGRYDHDPSLRSLIDVVPFGIPDDPPPAGGEGPRERFPEIGPDSSVVLWNGGLWPWLDAATPIRAVTELAGRRDVRLVFMGQAGDVPSRRATEAARSLAAQLGSLDSVVFFNDRWVRYGDRGAWLAEADCAVSTHTDSMETRFAFRTRLLDCVWAGLPIVCTRGDELGALVDSADLGRTVAASDPGELASAIEATIDRGRDGFAESFAAVRPRFTWERVADPIASWIEHDPPPTARGRGTGRAAAIRRGVYLAGRRTLDTVGVRDWPRI